MRLRANQVLSVKQARELLGEEGLQMTDEEVQQLIDDFDVIAQYSIKMVQNFKEKYSVTDKDKC
jgi:hypothetical protein